MTNCLPSPVRTIGACLALWIMSSSATWAQTTYKQMPDDAGVVAPQPPTRAGACAPATALRDLEWNNVRALIETGGTLWHERANWRGSYIVPKEDNVSTVFAGGLWLGGISPDQQLKLAAVMHRRNGKNDFWPGPLTNDGTAEVDVTVCDQYDRFFISIEVTDPNYDSEAE